jgi:hypothetical protein
LTTRQLSGKEGAVLGLPNSEALYEKLRFESIRLSQGWGSYDTFNFAVTAWHLFEDWPNGDPKGTLSRLKRHRHRLSKEMLMVVAVLRDLANGSKHFVLNQKGSDTRQITATHSGGVNDWFEYYFHERLPGVTAGDLYFSIRVMRNIVMAYFEWVFDNSVPADQFPSAINDAVRYCRIATRQGHVPPELWART